MILSASAEVDSDMNFYSYPKAEMEREDFLKYSCAEIVEGWLVGALPKCLAAENTWIHSVFAVWNISSVTLVGWKWTEWIFWSHQWNENCLVPATGHNVITDMERKILVARSYSTVRCYESTSSVGDSITCRFEVRNHVRKIMDGESGSIQLWEDRNKYIVLQVKWKAGQRPGP